MERFVKSLQIKTPTLQARVSNLSGGNQQKCVLAKKLNANCRVLLVDEPTRGIDVGAKREIYQLFFDLLQTLGTARRLALIEAEEVGKPIRFARFDIEGAASLTTYAAGLAAQVHRESYANLGSEARFHFARPSWRGGDDCSMEFPGPDP